MNKAILLIIFSFCLFSCTSQTDPKSQKEIASKIVIVGHFYPLLQSQYLNILKDQIQEIDGVAAIVLAGDMISKSVLQQYDILQQEFASHFDVPVYYIPGNHEMSNESMFRNKGSQFSTVGNQTFYLNDKKLILFSPHQTNDRASKANIDCANTEALAAAITDQSVEYKYSYLILADMRCFKRSKWKKNIQPLIDAHIDYVIIGDNESTKYTFTWEKYNGVPYIYQGITHRGHGLSGENTFVVINDDKIDVHHLKINNALDSAYKTHKRFLKLN